MGLWQVCYGKDATDEEIEAAITAANAKDFIAASPEGIYTMVIPCTVDYVAHVHHPSDSFAALGPWAPRQHTYTSQLLLQSKLWWLCAG